MIDEVSNIEQYIPFIEKLARDPHFSDPHFSYDPNNLYQAVKKRNQKIYVSSKDGIVNGIFVWLTIPERYLLGHLKEGKDTCAAFGVYTKG